MAAIHNLDGLDLLPPSPVHIPVFERLLAQTEPHEADFKFFSNFAGRDGLFLDVGGNIGNSALSIHLIQPKWEVISFEPNVSLLFFLERARKKLNDDGAAMSVHSVGLGDHADELAFYIPKIDDWYVVGEASFDLQHFDNPVVGNRLSSYSPHGYWELARTTVPVTRFDAIPDVSRKIADLPPSTELVLKMDVEGYEYTALQGMLSLVRSQRAIFMLENSGDPRVDQIFVDNGYAILDYSAQSNRLWRNQGKRSLNSFYVPNARVEGEFQSMGLV